MPRPEPFVAAWCGHDLPADVHSSETPCHGWPFYGKSPDMSLRISVLGPLTISVGGVVLKSRPAGERAVLGLLALRGGDPVPLWSIIDAVWDSEPPASASGIVQSYISRLRRALGQGVGVGRCWFVTVLGTG